MKHNDSVVADGQRWYKLSAPNRWDASVGSVIIGAFCGFAEKRGAHGPYRAVIMQTTEGPISITGATLVSLIEANGVATDTVLRIVYTGTRQSSAGFTYKTFDVFTIAESATMGHRRSA